MVIAAIALPGALGQPVHWSAGLVAILAYNWIVTTALGCFLWSKVLSVMPATLATSESDKSEAIWPQM